MLKKRILSLILGFAFTIFVVLFTNIAVVNVVIGVFMAIAVYEFDRAFRLKDVHPLTDISFLSVVAMFAINILDYLGYISIPLTELYLYMFYPLVLLVLFITYVLKHHKHTIMDLGATMLQIFYCVFLFSFLINIYGLENGKILIWYVFIGSWATDIFAFCIGKLFGKHKFTSISPNKTIEGCIGGIVGGVLGFTIFTLVINANFDMGLSIPLMIILGIICSIVSQIGDLFASSIKRYTGVKDFGDLLPGHGGILDRFDSTIFVIPLIYMAFAWII